MKLQRYRVIGELISYETKFRVAGKKIHAEVEKIETNGCLETYVHAKDDEAALSVAQYWAARMSYAPTFNDVRVEVKVVSVVRDPEPSEISI